MVTKAIMTWPEVAEYLGASKSQSSFLSLRANGLPAYRTSENGHWRFKKAAVDLWLKDGLRQKTK